MDRFVIRNRGATVFDKQTGLEWQRCPEGFVFSDGGTNTSFADDHCAIGANYSFTWQQALQDAKSLDQGPGYAGATDWRVPNVKELRSIIEEACDAPAVELAVFPDTPPVEFWSASPNIGNPGFHWYVDFALGGIAFYDSNVSRLVRLVRDGE